MTTNTGEDEREESFIIHCGWEGKLVQPHTGSSMEIRPDMEIGDWGVPQWLRALVAVQRIRLAASVVHNHLLTSLPRKPSSSSGLHDTRHICGAQAYKQGKHPYTRNKALK